jgi:pyruvate/2-oxoglutarate dehydrogenase complex dihydrolipoamide acyltransferase (E2) component
MQARKESRRRVLCPVSGNVTRLLKQPGQPVATGDLLLVLTAMKMEHEVRAECSGLLERWAVAEGDNIERDAIVCFITVTTAASPKAQGATPTAMAPVFEAATIAAVPPASDAQIPQSRLAELHDVDARQLTRASARRKDGRFSARDILAALSDDGTYVEWGRLATQPGPLFWCYPSFWWKSRQQK